MKCPGCDREEAGKSGDHIARMPSRKIGAQRHLMQNVKNKVPDCNSQESDAEVGEKHQYPVKTDHDGSDDGAVADHRRGDREDQNDH